MSNNSSSIFFPSPSSPTVIGEISVDILVEQAYSLDSQVTEHPVETGFTIADHVIRKPVKFSAIVGVTLSPVTWLDKLGSAEDKISNALEAFKSIYENATTITVVTPTDSFENMVMTSANFPRKIENGNLILIPCEFTQVRIIDTKTVDIPDGIVSSDIEESAGETEEDAGSATTGDSTTDDAAATSKQKESLLSAIKNGTW